ncbi:hypothetical protein EUGRSUZ_H03931 [Eucalyptus grandis]|uniref:Uncharacterized protein n=2 Tax=Eucalyptus grandis TaxID=71139 RepID=A0ACC3JV07_EUCGR|nr:hypothetical protein EUGRSUZ_H03931 [Eucalyptus grandis]
MKARDGSAFNAKEERPNLIWVVHFSIFFVAEFGSRTHNSEDDTVIQTMEKITHLTYDLCIKLNLDRQLG